jgi:hypothetical protein
MKKHMIIGLVLLMGLVLIVGCGQPQPPAPPPTGGPATPPTGAPATPPTGVPAAPPTGEIGKLPYLEDIMIVHSVDKNAKEADLKKADNNQFPENVAVIALKIPKSKNIPKEKELVVAWFDANKLAPLEEITIMPGELLEKGKLLKMKGDKGFAPGPYRVEIIEKDTGKKMLIDFTIGTKTGALPDVKKPGEEKPATGKPGEEKPATGAPGEVKAPPTAPGMETGAPEKPVTPPSGGKTDTKGNVDKEKPGSVR